jgi:hypothetical protein
VEREKQRADEEVSREKEQKGHSHATKLKQEEDNHHKVKGK